MTVIVDFPAQSYAPGNYTIPSTIIPAGSVWIEGEFDRSQLTDPSTSLVIIIEISADGGATWFTLVDQLWGGSSLAGTSAKTMTGRFSASLDHAVSWQIKGSITVAGNSCNSSGTISVS